MELVTLSSKELCRLDVRQAALDRKIDQREAAHLLGLSVRQVKRLCGAIVSSKELAERPAKPRSMPQTARTPAENHPGKPLA